MRSRKQFRGQTSGFHVKHDFGLFDSQLGFEYRIKRLWEAFFGEIIYFRFSKMVSISLYGVRKYQKVPTVFV